jgi:hypothetical protein
MFLKAFGRPIVIFNSLKPASELLDRRANIYSDRPRHVVSNEILCGGLFTGLMPYGDVFVFSFLEGFGTYLTPSWRRTRRAAHGMLTKTVVRDYHPTFRKEATILAFSILDNPQLLVEHVERSTASATMSILYDHPTLEDRHDKAITEIHAFIDRVVAAGGLGAYLADLFPWMMYIPERY